MSRRLHRAAQVAAFAALTLTWALGGLQAAVAASPSPSPSGGASGAVAPSPSGEAGGDGAAPELATFGLAAASGDRPDQRGAIELTAAAGSVVYDNVAVVNQSDTPLDLEVYSADAQNSADGTLGLPDRTVAPTGAGSWISVAAPKVTVPPQSAAGIGYTVVPVAITIPGDAEPGEHVAGVVASLTAKGSASNGAQTTDVNLEQRVGLRFYVTVEGPTQAALRVSGVRATYHPARSGGLGGLGSATVTYTLTNTGNVRLTVDPTVTASGLFGLGSTSGDGTRVEELLPKGSVTQTVELASVWPLVLDYVQVKADVSLPGDGADAGIGTPSDSTWMWAVPWPYLALIALVALAWWWLRRRGGLRARGGRHSHSAPPQRAAPDAAPGPAGREPVGAHSRPAP